MILIGLISNASSFSKAKMRCLLAIGFLLALAAAVTQLAPREIRLFGKSVSQHIMIVTSESYSYTDQLDSCKAIRQSGDRGAKLIGKMLLEAKEQLDRPHSGSVMQFIKESYARLQSYKMQNQDEVENIRK